MKIKVFVLLGFLVFNILLLAGCETVKGFGEGACAVGRGINKDAKGLWQGAKKADKWMERNAW